jgi:nucleoside-diphosphate-sugar epimerase
MNLVTGASGFLGSYLVKNLLRRGEKVRALQHSTNFELLGSYADKIEWVKGDLLDITSLESAMVGVEKIYHCAAIVSSLPSMREKAKQINIEGTANLFNAALANKQVKKVMHVSSITALGLPLNGAPIDENYYAPAGKLQYDYFKAKRFAEMEAWRAHAEGLDVIIVNPSGLMGAGRWHHEPLNAFTAVYNGLSFYMEGSNGFIDVRDTAEIMIRLMESTISGERFILSAENLRLKDLLFMIADEIKVARPKYKVNGFMSELAWRIEGMRALVTRTAPDFTRDDIRIARTCFSYSNAKIKAATGFNFRPLSQSIHETAVSFLESQKKGLDYATFD